MANEKKNTNEKTENEVLTDEQVNQAAGGFGLDRYKCQGGCGGEYTGRVPFYVNGKAYCVNCYGKYQQSQNDFGGRPDPHGRP